MKTVIFKLILILFISSSTLFSQSSDEAIHDEFLSDFNKPYFRIGALVQVVGDFQNSRTAGTNGFNISNFRIKMSGDFDKGIGYFVQTSFTKSPAILDAKIYYKFSNELIFDAGLFKSPFSYEFLTSAADIDFVNRSQVVSSLAPNRQIGVQMRGTLGESNVDYSVGIFNGNKFANNSNDNNRFMYSGRIAFRPDISSSGNNSKQKMIIGINASQSDDNSVNIPSINQSFMGKRFLVGGDARINWDEWLLASEVIYANLEPSVGNKINPFGYHITAGYMMIDNLQALLRWDSYKIDKNLTPNNQVILGFNFWPTSISELQLNYIVPTKSIPKHHQILVNAQVSI